MIGREKKAVALTWVEVAQAMRESLFTILGKYISCKAWPEDNGYWAVKFIDYRMPLSELYKLFDAVDGDEEMRDESTPIPEDMATSVGSFGRELANELLRRYMNCSWESQMVDDNQCLWLIGVTEKKETPREPLLIIAGKRVQLEDLKSRQELMEYLQEQGPDYSSLMNFCKEYQDTYQNGLCWSYPIPDGTHLGRYLVLVKEGLLSLPYNDADKVDYAIFCPEDAKLLETSEAIESLIWNWDCFDAQLRQAMAGVHRYQQEKEAYYGAKV